MNLYQHVATKHFENIHLLITQVGEVHNSPHLADHYGGIQKMKDLLRTENSTLNFKYIQFPEESHGTIPMIGTIDFFRFYFQNYTPEVKAYVKEPLKLEQHFMDYSQLKGYPMNPSEAYFVFVLNYLFKQQKMESHKIILEYASRIYPQSKNIKRMIHDAKKKTALTD